MLAKGGLGAGVAERAQTWGPLLNFHLQCSLGSSGASLENWPPILGGPVVKILGGGAKTYLGPPTLIFGGGGHGPPGPLGSATPAWVCTIPRMNEICFQFSWSISCIPDKLEL